MPRPQCPRRISSVPTATCFKPTGIPMRELDEVVLRYDEIEAIRLADHEQLYQEDVAKEMDVSRPTVGRILASARAKIADALVNGKAIRIDGGQIRFGSKQRDCGEGQMRRCRRDKSQTPNASSGCKGDRHAKS